MAVARGKKSFFPFPPASVNKRKEAFFLGGGGRGGGGGGRREMGDGDKTREVRGGDENKSLSSFLNDSRQLYRFILYSTTYSRRISQH